VKLDKFDMKILEALQADGRMPATRLAEHVGLSSSPTWGRVRRLEEAGILRGYHAAVAVEQLAPVTTIMVQVVLENHRIQDFQRFQQAIQKIPQIVECWEVAGGSDYVMRLVVRTIEEYQGLIDGLLQAGLGIQRYWTYVVTKPVKEFTGLPLETLLPQ
jgi:Lrp/AsnC family transcriptional regulator, regulator of ectoine-degradation genes